MLLSLFTDFYEVWDTIPKYYGKLPIISTHVMERGGSHGYVF